MFAFDAVAAEGEQKSPTCTENSVHLRGDFGTARFSIELADDPQERATGLMNRPSLAASAGMLFVYDAPIRATFWMKNTLIPLDMIFVDETGVVQNIHENAVPLDTTVIDGGADIFAVLEINGGMARAIGIEEGAVLSHPAFDQTAAAWPCKNF